MARHNFLTHKQVLGQPFNEFVTELKNLSEDCELGTLKDSLVKDIIICGVNDRQIKERFLCEDGVLIVRNQIILPRCAGVAKSLSHIMTFGINQ